MSELNLRSLLSYEWQSVESVRIKLQENTGISLSEKRLAEIIKTSFQDVLVDGHRVRLVSP